MRKSLWRRILGDQSGFTLIELSLAALLASTAILGVIGVLDTSRKLATLAERKQAAAHVGEQEVERVRARDYGAVALSAAPVHSNDSSSPDFYVNGGATPTYQWNQKPGATGTTTEPLAVDAAKGMDPAPVAWNSGGMTGKLYRYVTWADDPACGATPLTLCPGTQDYKRITVAVTVDSGGPRKPILLSTIVSDPNAGPAGAIINGDQNPLTDPSTKCLNGGGALVECVASLGAGDASTWFLHDTAATLGSAQPIAGSHLTHPTLAPLGICTLLTITGCPQPDLMDDSPPPAPVTLPPLFNYSTDLVGTLVGGRVLKRDTSCSGTPSTTDNAKGEFFVTTPLSSASTLTGAGGLSLSSETADDSTSAGTLCVRIYDVPNSILNLIAAAPTPLGTASYSRSNWPKDPSPVAFTFDFRGSAGNVTVPAGHRIGMRIWAASGSGADLTAIYDHPTYPSAVSINTTGS